MAEALSTINLRGLALPAIRNSGGYFSSKTRYDVAYGDLIFAVFCPIRGRFMNRQFGSALHQVVFQPSSVELQGEVDYAVRTAAAIWTPHIVIEDVRVLVKNEAVSVGIRFSLKDDRAEVVDRVIVLQKSGIVRLLKAVN